MVSGGRAVGMVRTVSVAVPKTGRMCEDDRGGDVVGGHLFRVMIAALWLERKKNLIVILRFFLFRHMFCMLGTDIRVTRFSSPCGYLV